MRMKPAVDELNRMNDITVMIIRIRIREKPPLPPFEWSLNLNKLNGISFLKI